MNRVIVISILLTVILLSLGSGELKAQIEEDELVSPERLKILILPSKFSKYEDNSIEEEVTGYVADIATNLGRFEVIDRNHIGYIVREQKLQLSGLIDESMITEMGNIAAAKDGILVNVTHFSQIGVPKEDNDDDDEDDDDEDKSIIESIIGGIVKSIARGKNNSEERYPNNIQTSLTVDIKKIDIETGMTSQSVSIRVGYTGGNKGKSKDKTINKLKKRIVFEMKNFYLVTTGVEVLPDGRIFIPAGYEIGVKKGTIFEIIGISKKINVRGKTYSFEADRVAFVEAYELLDEGNLAKPVRMWKPIRTGYKAIEFHRPSTAASLYFSRFATGDMALNVVVEFLPFSNFSGWLGFRYIRGKDSRDDVDNGFGIDFGPSLKLINEESFSVKIMAGIGGLAFFKFDDASKVDNAFSSKIVNTASASSIISLNFDYFKSESRDFSIQFAYRFDAGSSTWKNLGEGDDEPDYNAIWLGATPEIDISGFYISVGYKFTSLKKYF